MQGAHRNILFRLNNQTQKMAQYCVLGACRQIWSRAVIGFAALIVDRLAVPTKTISCCLEQLHEAD